jgi:hypothetical protein
MTQERVTLRDEARCLAEALRERPEAERILFMAHLNRWLEIMEGAPTVAPVNAEHIHRVMYGDELYVIRGGNQTP